MGKRKKTEIEERIQLEELRELDGLTPEKLMETKFTPAVRIIGVRPMKLKPIDPRTLSKKALEMSPEYDEIEDPGYLDEEGCILFKVNTSYPKHVIIHLIGQYLDRYGKKDNSKFHVDVVKRGFEVTEEIKKGKNLHRIAKERTGINKKAADSEHVMAEYRKLERAHRKIKKS